MSLDDPFWGQLEERSAVGSSNDVWLASRALSLVYFLDRDYRYTLVATLISHEAGLAPKTSRKFLSHQVSNQFNAPCLNRLINVCMCVCVYVIHRVEI
jgi:hypothetical protein